MVEHPKHQRMLKTTKKTTRTRKSQATTRRKNAAQQAAGKTAAKKTNERKPRKARAQRRSRPDPVEKEGKEGQAGAEMGEEEVNEAGGQHDPPAGGEDDIVVNKVFDSDEEHPSDEGEEFRRKANKGQQRVKPIGGRASMGDDHRHPGDPVEGGASMDGKGERYESASEDYRDDEDMDLIHVYGSDDEEGDSGLSSVAASEVGMMNNVGQRDPAILMRKFKDPEACLQFEVDLEFDDPVQDNAVVIPSKIDRVLPALSGLGVPTINPSVGPKPLEVLEFIDHLREYEKLDRARLNILMKFAFKGDLGQKWYHRFGGDYELMKNKLLNWMMHSQEWLDLNAKLVRGERFSDDMETHIRHFKLVAKYMGLKAESDVTKRCFIRSVGPKVITPMLVRKKDMSFKSLQTIMRMALDNQEMFLPQGAPESVAGAVIKSGPPEDMMNYEDEGEAEIAAINLNRKRRRVQNETPSGPAQDHKGVCFVCGRPGHFARQCKYKRGNGSLEEKFPAQRNLSRRIEDRICPVGRGVIVRKCAIDGEQLTAMLDTGASVNVITKKAAARVRGKRIPVHRSAKCVDREVVMREALKVSLNIGGMQANVILYIVNDAPADVLLGTPFLMEFSKGFREMLREFPSAENEFPEAEEMCAAIEMRVLEDVLNKYPKLILEDDQLPDPTRYYKGQAFELGLPEDKRDRRYFRPQYLPQPMTTGKFREILEPLVKAGVYVESKSQHNNPVMLVPKKKPGDFRLVVDNRLVNDQCKSIPTLSASPLALIKTMSKACKFTTVDCKNAYYSLLLCKRDREYTAISPPGMPRLELTRMPMGSKASAAALYQAMVSTLGDTLYRCALVYADDIIIFSNSLEDHIKDVDEVLNRLDRNGFCISRSKIELGKDKVSWLGYTISAEGIEPDQGKVQEILSMRRPNTLDELRSALGFWTYFASFIPGYSIIAAPLTSQLKKDNKALMWNSGSVRAWETIKKKLASTPIMGFPDYTQPLYLHTDACKSGFAAVLTQERKGRNILIDAISRTTTPAEKNYSSAKSECAGVIWAAKRWKYYLYAAPLTIIVTDSYGLQYLSQKGGQSALVQRWIMEMEGFRYEVRYRRGKYNIADFLSRQNDVVAPVTTRSQTATTRTDYAALNKGIKRQIEIGSRSAEITGQPAAKRLRLDSPIEGSETTSKALDIPEKRKQVIEAQIRDRQIQKLWRIACDPASGHPSREELQDAEDLIKQNGVILKVVQRATGERRKRIVVPLCMQKQLVQDIHEANHPGVKGTLATLQQNYWFRGMKAVTKDVVRHCPDCIARKGRPLTRERMAPDERPPALGDRWHIDGLHLPVSEDYDHLLVATDVATKYVILKPCKGETAEAAGEILMEITRRFGKPREVTTDRGRAFMSEIFMKVCEKFLIVFKPVGVGQPQADGMVERVNQTLTHLASIICKGDGNTWAKYVNEIEYALNTRISSVTKFSPYELVYGRVPPDPVYTEVVGDGGAPGRESEQAQILADRIKVLQQLAHENQLQAAKTQKSYHDACAQAHQFQKGDKVWYYKPSSTERGVTSKLAYRWKGPYVIESVIGPVTFTLKDKDGKIIPGTVHARHLYKPY